AGEVGGADDFVMRDGGANVGGGQLLAHDFDGVEGGANGGVTIGVHVRVNTGAAEADQNFCKRLGRKVDGRATIIAIDPLRIVLPANIFSVRLEHGAGQGGGGGHGVKKELGVTHSDAGFHLESALVILLATSDHFRDRLGGVAGLGRIYYGGEVRAHVEFAAGVHGSEGGHALGGCGRVEKGSDTLTEPSLLRF